MISRGAGRSAVAAAAYMSCSRMVNAYDGVVHDYTRKRGLVWQQVFLPSMAPPEWADREKLWNAVEGAEKAKDSRLAREFVAALPVELSCDEWSRLLTEFVKINFVDQGMCADVCIHDTDGHNPHAHIMLTVRPLDEQGKWQYKTEKEYLCVRNGEERGFTAAEFKVAQAEGWEKQYPYKVGKKKVYMTATAAEEKGYERASKYPKSTKFGRQNPIAERWNSEEQLVIWREAWATTVNQFLEQAGREERIDHRSHAARGLDEQPTIHEGVIARAMEQQGLIADRCELNRQIKADNALLRELKAAVRKLTETVARTIPVIAEGLERARSRILIFCYQLSHIHANQANIQTSLALWKPEIERYNNLTLALRSKSAERKEMQSKREALPVWSVKKAKELDSRIAELTEDLEELRWEKTQLLQEINTATENEGADGVRRRITSMEAVLAQLDQQEQRYSAELEATREEYAILKEQSSDLDQVELTTARLALRPAQERAAEETLQSAFQEKYSLQRLAEAKRETALILQEDGEEQTVRDQPHTKRTEEKQKEPKKNWMER